MATSQKNNTWVLWVVIAILALALLLPLVVKIGGSYYRWGFNKGTKEDIVSPECPDYPKLECPDCVCPEADSDSRKEPEATVSDTCLFDAGKLGLPKDVANYVCDGQWGNVSLQLQSGTNVPFGTFTMDAEHRVWVLFDFTVPPTANYSFSYENAERNLLKAPFIVGSELGWKGEERVPFTVCYDFEGECSLPENIITELFPTQ